ncbi:FAD-binding oxidoreductase [bacterium endosymbiont of Pedicinus badii]|uniref:FAD-binding oxidoreductase n=1 Tax=bacterium endosymbiont of Pedicinus badii TaxID=1719126 RepID=UPI0009B93545|nr:FAD-binding oxidoreductase [bacterium endosymbiont of Pedicinus badii]OQM34053.1 ferredoxin-NADP reductase [bacterium endosymbiont of Pedicinus badii]
MEWVKGTVVDVKHWTDSLFSIIVHAPIDPFIAGQFAKISLELEGKKVQRAYSYVNSPKNKNLEFYLVTAKNGKLSQKLYSLKKYDSLMISKKASGSFTLERIPKFKNLWMISTGTAIGPYLSILETEIGLEKFDNIFLVHAVRFFKDFSYLEKIEKFKKRYGEKLFFQPIVSREKVQNCLRGRIPDLIKKEVLQKITNSKIHYKNTHVMLCGNPNMVKETEKLLKNSFRMKKNFFKNPGNITTERYW